MAVTRLADVTIVEEVASANIILNILELDAFVQSGVMVQDSILDNFLNSDVGGKTIELRYLGPLPKTVPNISNDDPDVKSTPNKIPGVSNLAVRQSRNNSWSSMDLVADLNGRDPLDVVYLQVGKYWIGVRQDVLLSSLTGIMADSVANHGSDMVVDISDETAPADAIINGDAVIDALGTMGDRDDEVVAIALHSTVRNTLRKQQLIEYIPNARGEIMIPTYMGKRLIVDDGMTKVGTGADTKYYTYFFGPGAVGMGVGSPKVPFEVQRTPDAGNGGGQETVYSRVEMIVHPQGYQFNLNTTPTYAQLQDAANWTRAWERKRIPLAALISKG